MPHLGGNTFSSPPKESVAPLQAYANEISSAAETISAYCASKGLPHPSFDPQASGVTIPSTAPLAVQEARQKLIGSAAKIRQLATEPAEYLPDLAIHYQVCACLRWLCQFDVLQNIPLHSSVPYSELAATTGVPELQLRSVIRMATTSNLLYEPVPGQVAHNAVSALFITNPRLMNWARYMMEFSMPVAAALSDATAKWGSTVAKNETAFNIACDTNLPLFDYLAQTPGRADQFASYMQSVQASYGSNLKHLVTGFDWAGLGEADIVDVGGSTCSSSIALAEAFPKLSFIVQDLPDTLSNSSTLLSAQPESIRSRIKTQSYDFFTPQPVKGAAAYLFRQILHDWPPAEAVTILKNHLDVLKENRNARLIIMDTVLPPPGSISSVEEALLRVRDLTMIQALNSKERELGEFTELFAQAADQHGGLELRQVGKPPGSVLSVMEVVYRPHLPEEGRVQPVDGDGGAVSQPPNMDSAAGAAASTSGRGGSAENGTS